LTRIRILIVDDDAMIGSLLADTLEEMDYDVCGIAPSQTEAVAAALRLRPDLMLVDARLGSGSGVAAMVEIQRHFAVPHVFMSGERLPAGLGAPALMKPFGDEELAHALRRAAGGAV
jgi:DNA-binding response OmpR family regulator